MSRRGDITRQSIRFRLANQLSDHLDSAATAHGDLTRVIDNGRWEATAALQAKYLYFYTGAHSGIEVMTVSFVPGSYIGFLPTLAATVASGEPYEVHTRSIKVFNDAILRAELYGRERLLIDTMATLAWIGNQYEYTLGGITMDYLAEVRTQYVTNFFSKLSGPQSGKKPQWWIEDWETTSLLKFDKRHTQLAASGTEIRLIGQRKPLPTVIDSDTTELPASWVVERALMHVHERYAAAGDTEAHLQRADRALARATDEALGFVNPMPGAVQLRGTYPAAF